MCLFKTQSHPKMNSGYDMFVQTLTQAQNTSTNTNEITVRFANTTTFKQGTKLALQKCSFVNSIDNVSATNNNNTFSYSWASATPEPITVVIPDGAYEVSDLNSIFQLAMHDAGHYLLDGTGQPVYYMSFQSLANYNTILFTSTPLPVALPTGYTIPPGETWTLPGTAATSTITIPATNLRYTLGFNAGTFPAVAQATTYTLQSPNTVQLTPYSIIYIECDLVNNFQYNPSLPHVLYDTIPSVALGNLNSVEPRISVPLPVYAQLPVSTITLRLMAYNYANQYVSLPINDKTAFSATIIYSVPH